MSPASAADARARLGLARSYQRNNLFNELTVRENLALAIATASGRLRPGCFATPFPTRASPPPSPKPPPWSALRDLLDKRVDRCSYGARRQLEVASRSPPASASC